MSEPDLHDRSVTELSALLQQKKISAYELTVSFLSRLKRTDPMLNTCISYLDEQALASAQIEDQKRAKCPDQAHPLSGIPIIHKDNLCIQGTRTTCGSRMLESWISPYTATLVHRLESAGCVTLAKANMDEFAMGSTNENSYFGAVKNPWRLDCSPGGSSGGSSACVAARLVPWSTGSDTGGSIRQPAALCGILGLKPTYGRVSRYGLVAFGSSLDQAGPIARYADDLAHMMSVIAGHDHRDATSSRAPVSDYFQSFQDSPFRIGWCDQFFSDGLDPYIAQAIESAIHCMQQSYRHGVQKIQMPDLKPCIQSYYAIAPAEAASNLSRFDGIRFGYRCKDPKNTQDCIRRSRSEGFGTEVKMRIMLGNYLLSQGKQFNYYQKAKKIRQSITDALLHVFQSVDLIVLPTTANTQMRIGELVNDPIQMYLSDMYTVPVNLSGLPAISIPVGFHPIHGMPIGMQLIAPHFREDWLIDFARQYQKQTDWHLKRPQTIA